MKRKTLKVFTGTLLLAAVLTVTSIAGSADDKSAPPWLRQAASVAAPQYDKDVPAVVLHREQTVNVGPDGEMVVTTLHAVKLLTRDGKRFADAVAPYLQSASKVRLIRGWLIRPDGTTKAYGKDEVLDAISDPDDIYNELRVKTIDASSDADAGMVFGYETIVEERPLFTQDSFGFQGRLPTIFSKYTLNLPAGWKASSVTFNRSELAPVTNGSSYVWELRDLAPIPPEPSGLSVSNLAPRIVINYFPPTVNAHVYDSWQDVSNWYTQLSADSLTLDDTVAGKARELTANAKTELEMIGAIATYVQSLRYISLDLNVARGGGHRPRPANLVMQRGYGDCKDKANLMRTMLKALRIESYLVLIYSGDPTYVRAEWASPRQFNHCIIAVKVGKDTMASTVVDYPKLGRLLIFDATDPYTQVGDLPDHEQGSLALIAAGGNGDLVKMPALPPYANRMERAAEVELSADGAISGTIKQEAYGQSASNERGRFKELSADDYQKSLERWITQRVRGAILNRAVPADNKAENKFDLNFDFSAKGYAQVMQGRLMMFKPAMVGRLDQFIQVENKRVTPLSLDSSSYSETIKVKLPPGFVVDEMPEADSVSTPYGKYTSTYEVKGDYLHFKRDLVLNRTIMPASQYEDLSKFFGIVRRAEVTPVVLVKKGP